MDLEVTDLQTSGRVTATRYGDSPSGTDGIDQSNVSSYRVVIAGGGVSFDSANLQFAVSEFGGINQPGDVTVYSRPQPGDGTFESLPTSIDDNGTPGDISDDTLSATTGSFSELVFASNSDPLPVEMAGFDARTESDAVRLTWQTTSEDNNAGFEVQRRATEEADTWEEVGFVDSKADGGTANEPLSYRFEDTGLPYAADTLEYRLRQVDLDGTEELTDPVAVGRSASELQLKQTFPNPTSRQATVQFAVPDRREVSLRLYDTLGRQVRTLTDGNLEGRQEMQVDLSGLSSGTYFLRLDAEGQTETQQVTVVR
jgi:hypothetical protein